MSCDGNVSVFVQSGKGVEPVHICDGVLANGGSLSTDHPLQPAFGEVLLIRKRQVGPATPFYRVDSFTPNPDSSGKHNIYNVSLSLPKS